MSTLRKKIRILFEKVTGLHLFRILPRGVDTLYDIRILLPKFKPTIIFDVGANVGELTKQYSECFPNALIYCFEPVSSNFLELQKNTDGLNNVKCFQLAFSGAKGRANIHCDATCSSLQPQDSDDVAHTNTSIESVELDTVDDFCKRINIQRIGLLKIDTEGHDFEVLMGANHLLSSKMIDIIQVEAGMNPNNHKFVPLEKFKTYLESKEYQLFGIYEQVHEHYTGEPHLRRTNLVFIANHIIELNRLR